jgi:hypothetical protein
MPTNKITNTHGFVGMNQYGQYLSVRVCQAGGFSTGSKLDHNWMTCIHHATILPKNSVKETFRLNSIKGVDAVHNLVVDAVHNLVVAYLPAKSTIIVELVKPEEMPNED